MNKPQMPFDRREFLKGLLGGTAATTLGFGMMPPIAQSQNTTAGSVYNVRDYGALGDGSADDTDAILAAITELNVAGGGSLYIPAGTYIVSRPLVLLSNTTLYGDGMGATILKLPPGLTENVIGLVRTSDVSDQVVSNVHISDLTLDGSRYTQTAGDHYGFYCGVKPPQRHSNIGCWRVEIRDFRGYGFDPHEITEKLYLIDCISHNNGLDGITLDGILDGVIRGCVSFNNDRHGFNIITSSTNIMLDQCIAHTNESNGITVQNGSAGVHINACLTYSNRLDGIYCVAVNDNVITNNQVAINQQHGIRLRGCARTNITANRLRDNSQSEHDRFSEIILDSDDENRPTTDTAVIGNHVTCTGDIRARYGIREMKGEGEGSQANNAFIANKVSGGATSDYAISGIDSTRELDT